MLSHKIMQKLTELRKSGQLTYLRPDAKAQVTVQYDDDRNPVKVTAVVVSTQHHPSVDQSQIESDIISMVINEVIPAELIQEPPTIYVNPTGRFVIGGPQGDAGVTGRKIIVDTYGGWIPYGGGVFEKDPSKIDRSAAYLSRYVAKNCVAGLCEELEIQAAYAIGVAEPVSIKVNSFGTSELSNEQLLSIITEVFDFKPKALIESLQLLQPIYEKSAAYGHFGRSDVEFPWESLNKVQQLKECKANLLVKA